MAATIAKATGIDSTREKHTQRLGSQCARVEAATWRTFARANVDRDGSVYVSIERDGKILHTYSLGPEGKS